MKLAAALLSLFVIPASEASEMAPPALAGAVEELRQAVGRWNVTTTRFQDNGAVAAVASGICQFDWVVPDRVLAGRSSIPDWKQSAALLFYLNERKSTIEMASVDADGQLTVMAGAAGADTRATAEVTLADGRRMLQRYTRYAVGPDRFESRLETSVDGGRTWKPDLHQLYVRAPEDRVDNGARLRYRKRPQPYVPLT